MLANNWLCLFSVMTAPHIKNKERLREMIASTPERLYYLPLIKLALLLSIEDDKL